MIKEMAKSLQVVTKLSTYSAALQYGEEPQQTEAYYFLLALNPVDDTLDVRSYRRNELPVATADYLEMEKKLASIAGAQTVLVAADSLKALRKAYPNYYLDTDLFVGYLQDVTFG